MNLRDRRSFPLVWGAMCAALARFISLALSSICATWSPGAFRQALLASNLNAPVLQSTYLIPVLLSLGGVSTSEGAIYYRTVALSGMQAPGTPSGTLFSNFVTIADPVIDSAGRVAFRGVLQAGGVTTSNDTGIWSEGSGSLLLVAREGSQAPGTPANANFRSFSNLLINDFGRTAFIATLLDPGGGVTVDNNTGIWWEGSGPLSLVAREGSEVPGVPGDARFQGFASLVLNQDGKIAFGAALRNTFNNSGVWSDRSGALSPVVVAGDQAPGTPLGADFQSVGPPVLNASSRIAFRSGLGIGSGTVTSNDNSGIWSEGTGALALVAREGSQAPGTPTGANFNSFIDPVINDSGHVAFFASLQTTGGGVTVNNDRGIWSDATGVLSLVARAGSHAPGTPPGASFSLFSTPTLNSHGRTAFRGDLQTTGGGVTTSNNSGIWSEGTGTLSLVARTGSQAPGTPIGANFSNFDNPVINGSGATAFTARLQVGSGGVIGGNDGGLWAEDPTGVLTLVVRIGDLFPVAPGDLRKINGITMTNTSGGEDGRARSFNDDFANAFRLSFTDGSSGIFSASLVVPEPSGLILIASALTALAALALIRGRPVFTMLAGKVRAPS